MGKLTMSITAATLTVDGKVVGSLRDFRMEGTLSTGRRVIADVVGDVTALLQRPLDVGMVPLPAPRRRPRLMCHCCGKEAHGPRRKCNVCHFLVCRPCITVTAVDHGAPICSGCAK